MMKQGSEETRRNRERTRGGTHRGGWRLRGERRGKAQAIRRRMSSTSQRGVAQRKEAREGTIPLCAPPREKHKRGRVEQGRGACGV